MDDSLGCIQSWCVCVYVCSCTDISLCSVCAWFREGLLYASALLLHWDCGNFQVHQGIQPSFQIALRSAY